MLNIVRFYREHIMNEDTNKSGGEDLDNLHKILDEYYADRKNESGTRAGAHHKAIRAILKSYVSRAEVLAAIGENTKYISSTRDSDNFINAKRRSRNALKDKIREKLKLNLTEELK